MSIANKYGYTPDKEAIDRHLNLIAAGLDEVASERVVHKMLRPHGPDHAGQ